MLFFFVDYLATMKSSYSYVLLERGQPLSIGRACDNIAATTPIFSCHLQSSKYLGIESTGAKTYDGHEDRCASYNTQQGSLFDILHLPPFQDSMNEDVVRSHTPSGGFRLDFNCIQMAIPPHGQAAA